MIAHDCLKILREIKDVTFSTVDEENRPQARIIDVMIVEDEKLYFCTARGKAFYKQLMHNPEVAVTGMNKSYQTVRLSGKAVRLTDQKYWIDRIFEENPVMNDVYPGNSRYILEPFCIDGGELEFFDLCMPPIYRESFALGQDTVLDENGFQITDSCIGCGTCMRGCPQQCITEGTPFVIRQEHCLHCGLCYENCPVQAVAVRGKQDA